MPSATSSSSSEQDVVAAVQPPPPPPVCFEYRGEALAPMVRASTLPLRALALQYGADFCYTEELIDRSLLQTVRVENLELGTIDYIKTYDNNNNSGPKTGTRSFSSTKKKRPNNSNTTTTREPALVLRIDPQLERNRLVCQLGTGDAETALKAALHVHRDVSAIDVNMGCPKRFSVGGGMGSALLQDPERACRIVQRLAQTLSSLSNSSANPPRPPIPVSAKIRLLPDSTQRTVDFVTGLVNAGAQAVTIHGRYVGTPEQTRADWDRLGEVTVLLKSKFPNTRILVNGDFYTRQEFIDFQHRTGADGVVLARPALYNTSLFVKPAPSDTTSTTTGTSLYSYDSPLLLDKTTVVQDYLRHAVRYQAHYKNIKYVVCEMMNHRRHPTDRIPYLVPPKTQVRAARVISQPQVTIGQVCTCQSLFEICQLWNVDCYDAEQQQQQQQRRQQPHENQQRSSLGHDLAAEHVYSDAYLLQQQPPPYSGTVTTTTTTTTTTDTPAPVSSLPVSIGGKRARVESDQPCHGSND